MSALCMESTVKCLVKVFSVESLDWETSESQPTHTGWITITSGHSDRILHGECHYSDVIMGAMASQITSLAIVYSTVYSDADQTKHQSSASLAFVRGIHRWPVNSPHKEPVARKIFPLDEVIIHCWNIEHIVTQTIIYRNNLISS